MFAMFELRKLSLCNLTLKQDFYEGISKLTGFYEERQTHRERDFMRSTASA